MLDNVKILSNIVDDFLRRIKVRRYGLHDIQTPAQVAPFGVDSAPPPGMTGIYAQTNKKGKPVLLGYFNKSLLAADGEFRIFSLDESGEVATFVWLKSDGTMQLGGDAHNAVRFDPLKSGVDHMVTALNAELQKVQVAITGLGGSYTKQDVTVDIDAAKIDEIKTL